MTVNLLYFQKVKLFSKRHNTYNTRRKIDKIHIPIYYYDAHTYVRRTKQNY